MRWLNAGLVAYWIVHTQCAWSREMTMLMGEDGNSTKLKVSQVVPIGTPVSEVSRIMEAHGFKCSVTKNVRFAEDNPNGGAQLIHGPSDTLWCDSGELSSGSPFSKRWQVTFTISGDVTTGIFASVGSSGL